MQINTAMQRTGNSAHEFGHQIRISKNEKMTAQMIERNKNNSGKVVCLWQPESKTSNIFFC